MVKFEKMPWWRLVACGFIIFVVVFFACFYYIMRCKDQKRQVR